MIKTIIFDFGGVVSIGKFFPVVALNLNKKFGVDKEAIQKNMYAHETEYMLGHDSPAEFWEKVTKDLDIPYEAFTQVFSTSYEPNPEMINLIRDLKKQYEVVLHSDNFEALAERIKNDNRLFGLFSKMYFSNEMHFLKRDEASFRYVLADLGRTPEESVFVDDKEQSLVIPRRINMNTILFESPQQVEHELRALGRS